ncbi:hypothetical protein TPHA_0N01760 [Tetrapisispora phaffii CBS 4417]|uniref:Xylanolytic transcriptional activator regulatory domain-containing protein n=1 Tax=Tetrapisispora phaffii (strain ATCC 24235 / CBS 4417 / NBRC 1672 / NRRL Y-8282 / UCD 70-5) TaxID=1071381 RepID=G8C1C9_TETPH|nr:hypothetical protein TPHA_0N01760 [Tetrapisispora phaffii CBS 4417]CCE65957.1 hypothetical protein TPHA_0N01760 [Tetrapisispora phaffii CBS 4417]
MLGRKNASRNIRMSLHSPSKSNSRNSTPNEIKPMPEFGNGSDAAVEERGTSTDNGEQDVSDTTGREKLSTSSDRNGGNGINTENKENNKILSKNNLDLLLKQYQNILDNSKKDTKSINKNQEEERNDDIEKQIIKKNSAIVTHPCSNCVSLAKECRIIIGLEVCIYCEKNKSACDLLAKNGNNKQIYNEMLVENLSNKRKYKEFYSNMKHLKKSKSLNTISPAISKPYENLFTTSHSESMMNVSSFNGTQGNSFSNFQKSIANKVPDSNKSDTNLQQLKNISNTSDQSPKEVKIQYPRSSFYVGSTSVYDITLINNTKLDMVQQVQLSSSLSLRKVAPTTQFLIKDDNDRLSQLIQEREVDVVERLVYPTGKILISIFFKMVHPYIPILHESVFLEKYTRSYKELTAPLLATVYSLALQWWDSHPSLVSMPKPDIEEQLNKIAYRSFFDLVDKPKLSLIQTGLLLLQVRSEVSNNWVICSALVALAEELGLGVDCEEWKLPQWEKGLRRRLAWAVWSQDKWTAVLEGRQSHLILGHNWMVKPLTDSDLPSSSRTINNHQKLNIDSYTPTIPEIPLLDMSLTDDDFSNGLSMFKYRVALSIILGEIMNTFYSKSTEQITDIEEILKLAKPLQLKLRSWYQKLPSELSMSSFTKGKFNSNASLTLSYFIVELTLHRRILTSLKGNTAPEIVNVCRTAAKSRLVAAIDFVSGLKEEHINSFWHTSCTGGLILIATFASLLFVTSKFKEESSVFRDHLRRYIWMLKTGSKSFDKEKNALDRIHMLLVQIPGLLTDSTELSLLPNRFQIPESVSPQRSLLEMSSMNDLNFSIPQSNLSKLNSFDYLQQPLSTTNILEAQNSLTQSPSVDSHKSNTPMNHYSIFSNRNDISSETKANKKTLYKKDNGVTSLKNNTDLNKTTSSIDDNSTNLANNKDSRESSEDIAVISNNSHSVFDKNNYRNTLNDINLKDSK